MGCTPIRLEVGLVSTPSFCFALGRLNRGTIGGLVQGATREAVA